MSVRHRAANQSTRLVARSLMQTLIDDRVIEIANVGLPAPLTCRLDVTRVTASSLIDLADRIAQWRTVGIAPPPEELRHYLPIIKRLANVGLPDLIIDLVVRRLVRFADAVLLRYWPIVETVTTKVSPTEPITPTRIVQLTRDALSDWAYAQCVAIAAAAVTYEHYGYRVSYVTRADVSSPMEHLVEGSITLEIDVRSAEEIVLSRRRRLVPFLLANARNVEQSERLDLLSRGHSRGVVPLQRLAQQLFHWERELDTVAGALTGDERTAVRHAGERIAVAAWAGEDASQRACNLRIRDQRARGVSLAALAAAATRPTDPARWFMSARDEAETFITTYWEAIVMVANRLMLDGSLSGGELAGAIETTHIPTCEAAV